MREILLDLLNERFKLNIFSNYKQVKKDGENQETFFNYFYKKHYPEAKELRENFILQKNNKNNSVLKKFAENYDVHGICDKKVLKRIIEACEITIDYYKKDLDEKIVLITQSLMQSNYEMGDETIQENDKMPLTLSECLVFLLKNKIVFLRKTGFYAPIMQGDNVLGIQKVVESKVQNQEDEDSDSEDNDGVD